MAENKKSFIAYCDWQDTFQELPNDKAGKLIKHLLSYVNDEHPETDDMIIRVAFASIKRQLKRDLKKYEVIREKRSDAGKLGGRPTKKKQKKAKKANAYFEKQKNPVNVSVNVNDSVNDNDIINIVTLFYDYQVKEFPQQLKEYVDNPNKLIDDSVSVIDKIVRIDGYALEQVRDVLAQAVKDDFWSKQIISLRSLRKKGKNGFSKFSNMVTSFQKSKSGIDRWLEENG